MKKRKRIRSAEALELYPLPSVRQYEDCVRDLNESGALAPLSGFRQHGSYTRLDHCFNVSYLSYALCLRLGLDYRAAARGGLLHDFFLYDWHTTKHEEGQHAFLHPHIALANAERHFELTPKERDIIVKHMWPLTISLPKSPEAFLVSCVDKYCAAEEALCCWGRSLGRFVRRMAVAMSTHV